MPQLEVKTMDARSVWRSPDGQREIFEVQLEYNGQLVKAKTYSKDISTVGWSGTVESYEKEGRNGSETFVKQPPKDGGSYQSTTSGQSTSSGSGKREFDSFTMYLSYAKDIAVALLGTKDGFDEVKYGELLDAVSVGGKTLYDGRPGAVETPKADTVSDSEVIDMKQLDAVFGPSEEDKPWKES